MVEEREYSLYKCLLIWGRSEILLCVRGTTGIIAIAHKKLAGANVTRGIVPIWFSAKYDKLFAFHLLRTNALQKEIFDKTYGIALKQINLRDVRLLKLIVPPLKLQNKFSDLVQKVENLKEKQKQSETELQNLFNSLMQRAFKGEIK